MKKTVAGLFAAVLTTAGMATVSAGAPASAALPAVVHTAKAPARAQCYPGNTPTRTTVIAPNQVVKNKRVVVRVKVAPASGSGSPVGKVRVSVRRNGQIYRERFRSYPGNPIKVIFPGPAKLGTYNVVVRFFPKKCTPYQSSVGSDSFTVVPRP